VSKLEGRTDLVTGGSGGIGSAVAQGLHDAGAKVAISGSSSRTETVATELGCAGIRADLAEQDGRRQLYEECQDVLGSVDILVAAHGIGHSVASTEESLDAWSHTLEVNLTATFDLCQRFGAGMLSRGSGRIILVASMYAFFGGVRVAAYTASKGGIAQLTKALSNEWAAQGVNVNALAPGYVRTSLNEHVWGDPTRSAEIVDRTPAGRWGEPSDMVGPAVFLASDEAQFVHGVVLPVDGGFAAR
jgi:2-deoxy-D-gluconate 3-dehydrogenase